MSFSFTGPLSGPGQVSGAPVRRVRHEVRDGLAVAAFSATASSCLAVALMLATRMAH
jgi:hypothetical protein